MMLDVSEQTDLKWRVLRIGANDMITPPGMGVAIPYIEQWRRIFPTFHQMPVKTKEAVACLRMCEPRGTILGIGQKVSEQTFWLDDNPDLLGEYDDGSEVVRS